MKRNSFFLLVVLTIFLVSGCFNFPVPKPDENGTVRVSLTDAVIPLEDIEKLEVTIESMVLYGADGATLTEQTPLIVLDEAITVDIMTLIGEEIDLGVFEASGIYNQLRMEISEATLTANGKVFPVTVNSGSLKINNLGIDLSKDEDTFLVLDFDLSRSLKINGKWEEAKGGKEGHEDKVHMTPVIHIRHGSLYDVTGIATPTGEASPLLVALVPEEIGDTLLTFTHTDTPKWEKGEFRFCKVAPGSYTLKFFDNYTDEGFDVDTSAPLYTYPESVVVVDRDLSLGTIVLESTTPG